MEQKLVLFCGRLTTSTSEFGTRVPDPRCGLQEAKSGPGAGPGRSPGTQKNHGDVVVFPAKTGGILRKTYRIWDNTGDIAK